ncbi:MAG: hypothetical protein COA99_17525, partial [Moraxellaceae bacterium]
DINEVLDVVIDKLAQGGIFDRNQFPGIVDVAKTLWLLVTEYSANPYQGSVLHIHSTEATGVIDSTVGWVQVLGEEFHSQPIQATHEGMLHKPYVSEIVKLVEKLIRISSRGKLESDCKADRCSIE